MDLPKSFSGIGIIVSNWAIAAVLIALVIWLCVTHTGRLSATAKLRPFRFHLASVAECSKILDVDFADVALLEEHGGLSCESHTRRRACKYQVAWVQREYL